MSNAIIWFKRASEEYEKCEEILNQCEKTLNLIKKINPNIAVIQQGGLMRKFDICLQTTLFWSAISITDGPGQTVQKLSVTDASFIKAITKYADLFASKVVDATNSLTGQAINWENVTQMQPQDIMSVCSLALKYSAPHFDELISLCVIVKAVTGGQDFASELEKNVMRICQYMKASECEANDWDSVDKCLPAVMVGIQSLWMKRRIDSEKRFPSKK